MKTFKYTWLIKEVDLYDPSISMPDVLSDQEELYIDLQKKGNDGWELVSVIKEKQLFSKTERFIFFFKKENDINT